MVALSAYPNRSHQVWAASLLQIARTYLKSTLCGLWEVASEKNLLLSVLGDMTDIFKLLKLFLALFLVLTS